jgi:hypothetical protein
MLIAGVDQLRSSATAASSPCVSYTCNQQHCPSTSFVMHAFVVSYVLANAFGSYWPPTLHARTSQHMRWLAVHAA